MQQLIVYGPDGKTPIDPRSLPADAQEELRKFARFAARSVLVNGDPNFKRAPEWATPLRTTINSRPLPTPAPEPAVELNEQALMFALEPVVKKQAKQVRSVAE